MIDNKILMLLESFKLVKFYTDLNSIHNLGAIFETCKLKRKKSNYLHSNCFIFELFFSLFSILNNLSFEYYIFSWLENKLTFSLTRPYFV